MSPLMAKLLDFIQVAIELQSSVIQDIRLDDGYSDKTILLLSTFKSRHDELETLLDLANEVQ